MTYLKKMVCPGILLITNYFQVFFSDINFLPSKNGNNSIRSSILKFDVLVNGQRITDLTPSGSGRKRREVSTVDDGMDMELSIIAPPKPQLVR